MSGIVREKEKKKRKQYPKKGKVVRISDSLWERIEDSRGNGETTTSVLDRIVEGGREFFLLPDAGLVCTTRAEAKGKAVLLAVRKGRNGKGGQKKDIERPIRVREVV